MARAFNNIKKVNKFKGFKKFVKRIRDKTKKKFKFNVKTDLPKRLRRWITPGLIALALHVGALKAQRFAIYNGLSAPVDSATQVLHPSDPQAFIDSLINANHYGVTPRVDTLDLSNFSDTIKLPAYSEERSNTGAALEYDNNGIILEKDTINGGLKLIFYISESPTNVTKLVYLPYHGLFDNIEPSNTDMGAMNNGFPSNALNLWWNEPNSAGYYSVPFKADSLVYDTTNASYKKVGETYVVPTTQYPTSLNSYFRIYINPNKPHGLEVADTIYFIIPSIAGAFYGPDYRGTGFIPGGSVDDQNDRDYAYVPWYDSLNLPRDSTLGVIYKVNNIPDTTKLNFVDRFGDSAITAILNRRICTYSDSWGCWDYIDEPINSDVSIIPDTLRIPFYVENAKKVSIGYNLKNMWMFIPVGFAPSNTRDTTVKDINVVFTALNPQQFAWPRSNGSPAVLHLQDENGNKAIVRIYYTDIQDEGYLQFVNTMYASDYPNQIVIDKVEVEYPIQFPPGTVLNPGDIISLGWFPTDSHPNIGAFSGFPQFLIEVLDTAELEVKEHKKALEDKVLYNMKDQKLEIYSKAPLFTLDIYDITGRRVKHKILRSKNPTVVDIKDLRKGVYEAIIGDNNQIIKKKVLVVKSHGF